MTSNGSSSSDEDMTSSKERLKAVADKTHAFLSRLEQCRGLRVATLFRDTLKSLQQGQRVEVTALKEVCWEQLHTGHWEDVAVEWRDAYALAVFLSAHVLIEDGNEVTALKALDLGLMMGGDVFRSELEMTIEALHPKTNKRTHRMSKEDCKRRKTSEALPMGSLQRPLGRSPRSMTSPSLESFCSEFLDDAVSEPCLLEGLTKAWPAFQKWQRLEYFLERWGHRTVPIEIGRHYLADKWGQKMMTLEEFLVHHVISNGDAEDVGYLAQHPLFDQIPELKTDICIPEYCYLGTNQSDPVINAWFGPKGTVSPLHYDRSHNILGQVVGRKYIRLYGPEYSTLLHPMPSSMNKNSSQIDLDDDGQMEMYRLENVTFVDVILQSGDALFIPRGWWHYVRSLDISFSVSFWWN